MKKIVFALGIVNIIVGIIGFFGTVSSSFTVALLGLFKDVIYSVPFFALSFAMDNIEDLSEQISSLNKKIFKLESKSPETENEISNSSARLAPKPDKECAKHSWDCSRCGTVNKAGSSSCSGCGAMYYSWTDSSL